jgi:hypothetical protein
VGRVLGERSPDRGQIDRVESTRPPATAP